MRLFPARLKPVFYLGAVLLFALPVLIALPQHAAPQTAAGPLVLLVDPTQSSVHWMLGSSLHTVHGTFALTRGSLQVDPATGKASGKIVVDATSGKSGNDGRDRKMHREVLESGRFSEIIFRPDDITGKLETPGDSTVQVHGIFVLHGSEHEMIVPVEANLSGDHWTASAKFSIPFIDWGLKNPSNWLLKVEHSVHIELELKGTIEAQPGQ
ncbi:MAG TPA: YceI family protein [Candidatus Dormibacteraeota bacterium]|nr:YceI family protein [Candidatus Dormibacteraeota bacterium]